MTSVPPEGVVNDENLELTASNSKEEEKADPESSRPSSDRNTRLDLENRRSSIQVLDWDGPRDPGNPYNWSFTQKMLVTGTALLGTFLVPLNGTSMTVYTTPINREFGVSDASFPNSYWPVTVWSAGGALFCIIFLPLMEDLGVRMGYIIFYFFFILMIIAQAVAQSFATLIVTRFFSGGCVALLANTISSMIPDIWEGERPRAVFISLYVMFYLLGSTAGPAMFGDLRRHVHNNWRWIFYIELIIYGAFLPLGLVFIKETRKNVILRRRAKHLRATTSRPIYTAAELSAPPLASRLMTSMTRSAYLLISEPVLLASTLWSAFAFGTVFLFTQSTASVFDEIHHWSEAQIGFSQGAVAIGEFLGFFATLYSTRVYLQSASRNTENPGHPIPEARLYVSTAASFIGIVGGMFVYAWTSYPHIHWIAPAIGLAMVGFGINVVVSAVTEYITDLYAASGYAGSAVSAVVAGENTVAAFLPLAAMSMYDTLGLQWASTLLAFLAMLLSFAPLLFIWKGSWFRKRSPFMLAGAQKKDETTHSSLNEA
ncbi:Hypothetical protein R9X50_00631000 [Acrodontium crateriforme]|uniref:Major facilitator superfamily (MFS) profile domain-containing protein n=1 Tax=Acrodontium crateriforme TaxID=150365 RepID=A0AAQ3M8W9_9PEZI|nr:Hypothetical protein R9X50_00631000 [Acrodontium crateriforme]